jgi:hypothetical protein
MLLRGGGAVKFSHGAAWIPEGKKHILTVVELGSPGPLPG